MYCANCGTKLESGTCSVCGTVSPVSAGRRDAVSNHALAGWGQRAGASIVDGFVLLVPELLLIWAFHGNNSLLSRLPALGVQGIYLVYLLSRPRGQTIGNRVAKTRVLSASSGQPITTTTAFTRWIVAALFNLSIIIGVGIVVVLLDILWPLWDPRRQTLHDKVAGTIVVLV